MDLWEGKGKKLLQEFQELLFIFGGRDCLDLVKYDRPAYLHPVNKLAVPV